MAVKLIPKFKRSDIVNYLNQKKQAIEDAIIMRLKRVGENFVKNARSIDTYKDRTGNLRSSIGYVVLKNGQAVAENFQSRAGGKDGVEAAKKLIDEVKGNFPSGFVLIVVAGMDYAAAVESKGYDVITGSSQIAKAELKKSLKELADKLSKRK